MAEPRTILHFKMHVMSTLDTKRNCIAEFLENQAGLRTKSYHNIACRDRTLFGGHLPAISGFNE
ncbi:hypothetical protein D3C87_2137910 [compost metagenome]